MPATSRATSRILTLAGCQNCGPAHWQSCWKALHGFERVQQADWNRPSRSDWIAQLDATVRADPRPTALVAHSGGDQGHINGESGLGDGPEGLRWLQPLMKAKAAKAAKAVEAIDAKP